MPSNLRNGGFLVEPKQQNSGYDSGSLLEYVVSNGYNTNINPGDPVKLNATGTIEVANASTDIVLGVFTGMKPEGQPTFIPLPHHAAGTSARPSFLGAGQLTALVAPPSGVFEAQFDGSVSAGDVGTNFDVTVGTGTVLATGTAAKRISNARVHASSRSDATGVVKCLGISTRADNAVTDAFPLGLFRFNNTINTRVSLA